MCRNLGIRLYFIPTPVATQFHPEAETRFRATREHLIASKLFTGTEILGDVEAYPERYFSYATLPNFYGAIKFTQEIEGKLECGR